VISEIVVIGTLVRYEMVQRSNRSKLGFEYFCGSLDNG
jgi:hypothetical protein